MTILVTGASGFVGQHVLTGLSRRVPTIAVRGFDAVRPSADPPRGVEAVVGLLEDPETVRRVLDGVEAVIHLAAKVDPGARESDELWRVNVEGTRSLYSAAIRAGCRHFLYMSSAGVYGTPRRREPFREDDDPCPVTPYQRTKWEAEQVLRGMDSPTTILNVLRPAGIYGPGSRLEIPQYRRVRKQRWVVELSGGVVVHPTYVDDVVHAILAILAEPAPHRTVLNIGGERPIRLQDLEALLAETLGVARHRLVVPTWLAGPVAYAGQRALALKGRSNPLLRAMCRGDLFSAAVDDSRFRERYSDAPVASLRDGMRETIDWASRHRLV